MNVYIDCGVHTGNDIDCFRQLYDTEQWRIIGFEPAPDCLKLLKEKRPAEWFHGIELIEAAVSDHAGEETFYEGKFTVSGTLRRDKNKNLSKRTTTVEVIDFAEFLDQFDKEDYIIVSMDIEGAEYDVLDHLINTDKLKMINEMYIEYHTHRMKIDESEREKRITETMNEHIGKDNVYIEHCQNHDQFIRLNADSTRK